MLLVVVQARMSSTRLPGKVMKEILGKPVLIRQLERMKRARFCKNMVVAATTSPDDDVIEEICRTEGFDIFRGHPDDLLDRHYKAGKIYDASEVVKIPSDCPVIDPEIIDNVIQFYYDNPDRYDFVSNLHPPSWPDGNDVELIPMKNLELAWNEATKKHEREHTTSFFWDHPSRFRIGNVGWETGLDYSRSHRFTLDYQEDFDFIKRIYEELYPLNPDFKLGDILNLLDKNSEIYEINQKYAGEYWYKNHVDELKNIDTEHYKRFKKHC